MAKKKPVQDIELDNLEDRLALLRKTAREINKNTGVDTLHFGSDLRQVQKIPFGFEPIDELLGGGVPYGNFFTIWGSPGCGKSTLAHMLTASAQKQGKLAYYIALEPYDQARARQFGVDTDKILIGEFPQAEQSLDTIIEFSKKKLVDLVILDSIHSLSPKGEQEDKKGDKSVGDDTMALLARKLSQFFRMAVDPVKRGHVAVVLIGQTRIGLNGIFAIEQLTGGNALHHYSKGILHLRKGQKADAPTEKKETGTLTKSGNKSYDTVPIGFDFVAKVDKCQIDGMSSEGTTVHVPYYFESGFYLPERIKKEIDEEEAEIDSQEEKVAEEKND
jgi:RecA/RadA recombinase